MPHAIMRFKKTATGGIVPAQRHNEREKQRYKSNSDIDLSRIANDHHIIKPDKSYKAFINRRIEEAGLSHAQGQRADGGNRIDRDTGIPERLVAGKAAGILPARGAVL